MPWRIKRILLLAFTAVILTTVLNRAVRRLQRLGIRKRAIALLDAHWKALAVFVIYIIIQQIDLNLLTPLVMQRQVSLTRRNVAFAINFCSLFRLSWSIYGFTADHYFASLASGIDY